MHPNFATHKLNAKGIEYAVAIAEAFDGVLEELAVLGCATNSREFSIAKTKLEEACFFAKKSMAIQPEHQQAAGDVEARAKAMFDAYNEQGPNPWKTFDGRDVPRWHELNDQVRAKWCAAAGA